MKLNDVMQKLSSDKASWTKIQAEVKAASDKRARFLEIVKERGMTIDTAELDATAAAVAAAANGELDESQLQSVSGGLNFAISGTFFKYDSEQKVLIGLVGTPPAIKMF